MHDKKRATVFQDSHPHGYRTNQTNGGVSQLLSTKKRGVRDADPPCHHDVDSPRLLQTLLNIF